MPADPLEALRQPEVPIAPSPAFAAALRARVVAALGLDGSRAGLFHGPPAAATVTIVAPALSVYLCVRGAPAAIDFYREAFGAVETMRMTGDDGRVGHAEITLEGMTVMLADEHPEVGVVSPETLGGTPVRLYLHVGDVDATYARAVAAGATGERPPADQFHGNRNASLRDPFGHRWMLTQPIEAVSAAEMARRAPDYTVTAETTPSTAHALPTPTGQLGYFTLSAPDVDRAAAFYAALFGWHFEPSGPGSTGRTYSHVDNTAVPFGIHDAMDDPSPHHYYRVADLQAMMVRVRELGGEVLSVDEYASGGSARCRDDQGVEFDLWQAAPGY
jgi:uncharacterized glyoxalase superfamily protein PhnB